MESNSNARGALASAGFALLVFLIAVASPFGNAENDPYFTPIVSQAILEHGTIRLDPYVDRIAAQISALSYQVTVHNGHTYYIFPLGGSLFSLPFVGLANLLGMDMTVRADNMALQNWVSALFCTALFLILYATGRCYLPVGPARAIALVSLLGSSLISTGSTGLWSSDFAALFLALSAWLLVRICLSRAGKAESYWLGACLFSAFLSRPTAAPFAVLVLAFLALTHPKESLKAGGMGALLLLPYLALNLAEFGRVLPPYYDPTRLDSHITGQALNGLLFSPSRGLFVFSPFLLVVGAGLALAIRRLRREPLFWLCVAWFTAHLLVVARFSVWWGGYSYGPRLLMDVMPALTLLTVLVWRALPATTSGIHSISERLRSFFSRSALPALYLTAGAAAILINSVQGLYNQSTFQWNWLVGDCYLFDWRYPQFLASPDSLQAASLERVGREMDEGKLSLTTYRSGDVLTYHSAAQAVYLGWWAPGEAEWWSETRQPQILFVPDTLPDGVVNRLEINTTSYGAQEVTVSLNGRALGQVHLSGAPQSRSLPVPAGVLRPYEPNLLEFSVPGAHFPSLLDVRRLGPRYALHRLGLGNTTVSFKVAPGPLFGAQLRPPELENTQPPGAYP